MLSRVVEFSCQVIRFFFADTTVNIRRSRQYEWTFSFYRDTGAIVFFRVPLVDESVR